MDPPPPSTLRSTPDPPPGTWDLPAVADPAQAGGRFAPGRDAGELHVATLHRHLLHLHRGHLGGHQDGERGHLVVGGVRVELAEVTALVQDADVGEGDAHQPRREEHHLETVVLQGCRRQEGVEDGAPPLVSRINELLKNSFVTVS